jgi:hypothetical protein
MTARQDLLRLGVDLTLPLELVTRRTAVVGQTDTGKTSTAVVLVEEARKRGVQVVVIDPSGAWWGVTSSADGKGPGLDMVVLGGEHGEIPLNDRAGRPVARLVAQQGVSPVLDLDRPHFRSWAGRQRFVADFLSELYEVVRGHVLVVIDEAHRFAPQAVRDEGGDVARCLGAVVDVVALGRRRGLSVVVITQRLAKLHKDVLELCEIMFAHRLRGNNDLAQLRGWVEGAGEDWKAIRAQVVGLERGVAHVSAPTLGVEGVYRIRPKATFDSSRTLSPGESAIVPTAATKADLEALRDVMAQTIEEAKLDDPKALRARIVELEREVARRPPLSVSVDLNHEVEAAQADRNLSRSELDDIAEVLGLDANASGHHGRLLEAVRDLRDAPPPGLPDVVRAELRIGYQTTEERLGALATLVDDLRGAYEGLGDVLQTRAGVEVVDGQPATIAEPEVPERRQARGTVRDRDEYAPTVNREPAASNGDTPELVAGARRMLDALRRYPSLTRAELSTLARTFGGSMRNNLSALRAQDLVAEDGGRVSLTRAGRREAERFAKGPAEPYTTDEIVQAHLAQTGRGALVAGARRVLDVVLRSPDRGYTRSELERLANSAGGSFRNNLSALRRRGLVEERNRRVYPSHTLYADRITP